ncbi:MAG: hypothetical protein KDD58_07445, partial [Bdellovibrionales bacterium]|nr:hypothetical protein [Bdellovibrionales bacterium]
IADTYISFATEDANYNAFQEAYWLSRQYNLVVMNEDKKNLIISLCPEDSKHIDQNSKENICPVIYYGSYNELCDVRQFQRHIETGVKAIVISAAVSATGIGPILLSKAGSLAVPIEYALTAHSIFDQGMDQYEIWQQECLGQQSEGKTIDDKALYLLWSIQNSPNFLPIKYKEEDESNILGLLMSLTHPSQSPDLSKYKDYIFKSPISSEYYFIPQMLYESEQLVTDSIQPTLEDQ